MEGRIGDVYLFRIFSFNVRNLHLGYRSSRAGAGFAFTTVQ